MSISHWGIIEVGYFLHEVDPTNPRCARARYIRPGDPDYCPTATYQAPEDDPA